MYYHKLIDSILDFPRYIKQGAVLFLDIIFCVASAALAFYLRLDNWDFFEKNSLYSVALVAQVSCGS